MGNPNSIGASVGPVNADQFAQTEQQLKLISEFNAYKSSDYGTITLGHVYAVIPYTGIHAVMLASQGNTKVFAMTCYPGSNRINGMRSPQIYLPGTTVVMLIRGDKSDKILPEYIIVGAVDVLALQDANSQGDTVKHMFDMPVEFYFRDGLFSLNRADCGFVLDTARDPIQKANYSYGKPIDGLAGEFTVVNSMGNGLFANEFMCALKGSERARVETFLFDNSVRVTADHYEIRNALYENKIYFNGHGVTGSERVAQTLFEGIGSLDGTSHTTEVSPPAPELKLGTIQPDSTALRNGYFSYQKLQGNLADGKLELLTIPPSGSTYLQNNTAAPGVLSIETSYEGAFRIKAAREISLEKTVYITAPKEMIPCDTNTDEVVSVRKEWDQEHDLLEEEGIVAGGQFIKAYDKYNRDNSLTDMRKQDKNWVVPTKEQIYASLNAATGGSFAPDEAIVALDPLAPHYDAPSKKAYIKPYMKDGKREGDFTIYNTSSGIKQLPDGSVVIYGGNGEEIRMFRGNIYITCPGDIIYQPGRDSINMAPRNNIIKAGTGILELSSQNTASFIANGNIQICASADGITPGTLLIENKSPLDFSMDAFEEGGMDTNTSKGGGIILKSSSRAMLVSPYAYIGSGSAYSGSLCEMDFETTEFHSANHKHYIENLYSLMGRSGSAISMGGGAIELLASSILSGTSAFVVTGTQKELPYYDRTGEPINVSVTASTPTVLMRGDLIVANNVDCGGVSTPSGGLMGANVWHSRSVSAMPSEANLNTSDNDRHEDSLALLLEGMQAAFSDLSKIGVILPTTVAYRATNFYFPLSSWQAILTGGSLWREIVLTGNTGSTMTFPGKDRWDAEGSIKSFDVSAETLEDKTLSGDYKVNV